MKKTIKKLALSKESLRHLSVVETKAIAGGISHTFCATACGPCTPPLTQDPSCDCTRGIGC